MLRGPLAYFLTWTCYGTWLQGDKRGSIDHRLGKGWIELDDTHQPLEAYQKTLLKHDPFILDARMRSIIAGVLRAHATKRGWDLRASNVRSNHVHVVVSGFGNTLPERVMTEFKAYSTRALREARCISDDRKVWTRHGSTRWIYDEHSLARAIEYVTVQQDDRDWEKPMH